jgi:hypothetical protein
VQPQFSSKGRHLRVHVKIDWPIAVDWLVQTTGASHITEVVIALTGCRQPKRADQLGWRLADADAYDREPAPNVSGPRSDGSSIRKAGPGKPAGPRQSPSGLGRAAIDWQMNRTGIGLDPRYAVCWLRHGKRYEMCRWLRHIKVSLCRTESNHARINFHFRVY